MRRFNFQAKDSRERSYLHRRFLPDLAAAKLEAVRYALALQHSDDPLWPDPSWTMRIFDDFDCTVFTLTFAAPQPIARAAGRRSTVNV